MAGERYRLVFSQNGRDYISAYPMNLEETLDALDTEASMHEAFGWTVTRGGDVVVARKGGVSRAVSFKMFSAHDDGAKEVMT